MALFESYERRIDKVNAALNENGIASLDEAHQICKDHGFDPYEMVRKIQPIAFENACWAYVAGAAIAIKKQLRLLLRLLTLSVSVYRASVSLAPQLRIVRLVSVTAVQALCY